MWRLIAAAAASLAFAWGPVASAQTARFASFPPSNSSINKQVFEPWVERVNKAAEGSLTIQLFSGGTLGRNPSQQHKLARDGVAQIAYVVMSGSPGQYPEAVMFELPFLVENATEGSVAHWRLFKEGKVRGLSDVHVISTMVIPPYGLHGSMPLDRPAQLKGKKIRVGGAVQSAIVDSVGAVPVGGIAISSVAESLSRGVLDGTLGDWNAVKSFRLHEVSNHHLDVPLGGLAVALVMNAAAYKALAPKAKAALEEHGGEAFARFWGEALDREGKAIAAEVAKEKGQTVAVATGEVRAAYQQATASVVANWLKENPGLREQYDALGKILGDIRGAK